MVSGNLWYRITIARGKINPSNTLRGDTSNSKNHKTNLEKNNRDGFFLEDKGWSLAIHAKDAPHLEAKVVLTSAREKAAKVIVQSPFRLLGDDRFLEIAPIKANKANAVEYLMGRNNLTDSFSIYIGDDDKDEQAFSIIKKLGGVTILVSTEPRKTLADFRLQNPQSVLQWLRDLAIYI